MLTTRIVCVATLLALVGASSADSLFVYKQERRLVPMSDRYIIDGGQFSLVGEAHLPGYRLVRSQNALQAVSAARPAPGQFITNAYVNASGGMMYPTQDIYIAFMSDVSPTSALAIVRREVGGEILEVNASGLPNVLLIRTPCRTGAEVLRLTARMAKRRDTRYAFPNMVMSVEPAFIPNDPLFGDEWHLRNTGQSGGTSDVDFDADDAWDLTTSDPSIKTLIMDNGVDGNHPDLVLGVGATFTGEPGNGTPYTSSDNHGTPVASCVAATMNNSIGVVGVAPSSQVISAKPYSFISPDWYTETSWLLASLDFAYSQGARITNNSWTYDDVIPPFDDKLTAMFNAGMVHFAAAGNANTATVSYPASSPNVVSVMSINRTGARSSFSSYGPGIDFASPGSAIVMADRVGSPGYATGDYVTANGTSFASPNLAGVTALVLGANPLLSSSAAVNCLAGSALDLGTAGYDTTFGNGLPNARQAVQLALGYRWTGTITFGDLNGPAPTSTSFFFDLPDVLRDRTNTTTLSSTAFDQIAPDGQFEVYASCRPWLRKKLTLNNSGTVISQSFSMTNGDADGSGEVDAADIDFVIQWFGTSPTQGEEMFADLDRSGEVDAADIDVAISNFGAVGD